MYTELRREVDYGTPPSKSVESITLEIDGESVIVPKGTSLMRAAAERELVCRSYARPTA